MAHLIAASVEVKGDVAEEGNGNENNGDLKWKRKVSQKYLHNCYDVDAGDEPKKAIQFLLQAITSFAGDFFLPIFKHLLHCFAFS